MTFCYTLRVFVVLSQSVLSDRNESRVIRYILNNRYVGLRAKWACMTQLSYLFISVYKLLHLHAN
jgi:hypothetical protein